MLKTGRRVLSASTLFNTWGFLNTYPISTVAVLSLRVPCPEHSWGDRASPRLVGRIRYSEGRGEKSV